MDVSTDEMIALRWWAGRFGVHWKRDLNLAWYYAKYPWDCPEDVAATLQGIRNGRGPSWLQKFKLPE